ncbi:hypothetical protein [Metabacillus sp. SLBN-84]
MSDFDFNLDIEAELAGIRGHKEKVSRQGESRQPERKKTAPQVQQETPKLEHGGGTSSGRPEPEEPALSHSHGGEDATSSQKKKSVQPSGAVSPVDWKRFKTLPGIFEHVGGDRPVRLNPDIKRLKVSGIPEPMLAAVQKRLKEKHTGAVVAFPWGEYEITEKNRVFTTKASLLRYLMFDAFRDEAGTHIQYAKQWMVLQHPVFDQGFNPDTHLSQASDELDIYTLLFVAHTSEEYREEPEKVSGSELDYQTAERIGMLNMGMGRLLDKLNEQEAMFRTYTERSTVLQTVTLLDRMGLLAGGLPRDVGELMRVLASNRKALAETDLVVSGHIQAEEERKKTLARQERLRQMQNRAL